MAETTPSTPVTPVVPPDVAEATPTTPTTPTPIPALSGQDATMSQVAPLEAEAGQHYKNAEELGKPTPTKSVPHARLMAMVTGLAQGLSAFGTSIATHGKEGGAPEVEQLQGEQQRQKIEAQQAAQAQKNQQIQQQITLGDTAHKQAQNIFLMAQMPDELGKSHFEAQAAGQVVQKGALDIDTAVSQYRRENYGLTPPSQAKGGSTAPITPDERVRVNTYLDSNLKLATGLAGATTDDVLAPAIKNAQEVRDNPNATREDISAAGQGLANALEIHGKILAGKSAATEENIKQQTASDASPVGDVAAAAQNQRAESRYQIINPGKPLPDQFKITGTMSPTQIKRVEDGLNGLENAAGIQATRESTAAMRAFQLNALQGPQGIDPSLAGPAYLDAIAVKDPGQADMIKAYGQGRLVLSPAIARTAQGQALTKQILRAYPTYIAAKAEGYQKQYNEFTTGKTGTAINAYKTSLDHLNAAFDNVAGASDIELNNPASKVHQQLDVDKEYLSTELAKAVSNGNMTEGEKDGMLKAIDGKVLGVATKGVYQNKLRESVRLLQGKLNSYQSQWKSTQVEGSEPPSNLTDAADSTQKLAGSSASGATPQSHVFDSKAWAAANPGKDVNAAITKAKNQGYEVK